MPSLIVDVNDLKSVSEAIKPHGKWIMSGHGTYCSKCGTEPEGAPSPYCPHCGAKMDGEEVTGLAEDKITTFKKRLTTDMPQGNTEAMLNFAYVKDKRVFLSYAGGEENKDLCEYISKLSKENGCHLTPKDVMEGACMECDCELAYLFTVATQAAELRERLKQYEDQEEKK